MDEQFRTLNKGEVLSVDDSSQILIGHRTFRVSEFSESIRMQLEYGLGGWTEEKDGWFSDKGIHCEVLRFGANGWQKGRVRISLEFCPDESRSGTPAVETSNDEEHEESDLADILADNSEADFPELSESNDLSVDLSDDLEDLHQDSLLDDVWQDMNQGLGEGNQY